MPSLHRSVVLSLILAGGCIVLWTLGSPASSLRARWPSQDAFFDVPGWQVSPATVTLGEGQDTADALIQRMYRRADGLQAEFVLWTAPEPEAKQLYRKGPDRDFLGAGYSIEPAPADLVPPIDGGGTLVARQGNNAWLLLYTFGERRGRLGDGPLAWSLAEFDALTNKPNDYFLARIAVPFTPDGAGPEQAGLELTTLFDRLSGWYAQQPDQ